MEAVILLLLIFAVVVFLLATFGATTRLNLVALGLALFATAFLLSYAEAAEVLHP